jgi:hypothetical protein
MTSLQAQLQQISADFVTQVLAAMRDASLADMADEPQNGGTPGRRARTTPARTLRGQAKEVRPRPEPVPTEAAGKRRRSTAEEVQRYKDMAFRTARQMPPGFSKGDLMKRTGGKVDMGRFLGLLVDEGLLTRQGERRSTRYWVK